TARRRAVDDALAELDEGREAPSFEWRRRYSLVLGLERLLDAEQPTLKDGAELSEHQVDALSGTLAALVAEIEKPGSNGRQNGAEARHEGNGEHAGEGANGTAPNGAGEADDELAEDEEEPRDWDEAEEAEE